MSEPSQTQVDQLAARFPDTVLLFNVDGDHVLYGSDHLDHGDALAAAESVESFIAGMIASGVKVAVVEQVADAQKRVTS